MGPSGYGFLHPGIIDAGEPALNTLVNQTLAAAALLDTSAYVHWDGAQLIIMTTLACAHRQISIAVKRCHVFP